MSRKHAKPGSGVLAALAPYSKAIAGAVFGGALMWLKVRAGGIDGNDLGEIIGAVLAGAGLVWAVPNKDPRGKKQDESVQPPRRRRRKGAAGRAAVERARAQYGETTASEEAAE